VRYLVLPWRFILIFEVAMGDPAGYSSTEILYGDYLILEPRLFDFSYYR
jgi:hypothetical protein